MLIPKPDPSDPFKVRRHFAYLAAVYALAFTVLVLYVDYLKGLPSASVAAYVGIPSVVFGFVSKMYFDAILRGKDDGK